MTTTRSSPPGRYGEAVPRSSYHHGNLRAALVDAAVGAARRDGLAGLALRELARRVGVSHNAAYRHFARRDDLVAAVAEQAMTGLVAVMHRELEAVDAADPALRARLRLAGIGRAYVGFARTEPGLFEVAFASFDGADAARSAGDSPYLLLGEALDDLVGAGVLASDARAGAEELCWSTVHGFAVLALAGHFADADARLELVLRGVDRSLGATTGAPPLPAS